MKPDCKVKCKVSVEIFLLHVMSFWRKESRTTLLTSIHLQTCPTGKALHKSAVSPKPKHRWTDIPGLHLCPL